MKPHSADMMNAAVELHDQGVSYCEIARRLGTSHQTIRRWVVPGERERHNGVRRRNSRRKAMKYRDLKLSAAPLLYRNGYSYKEIGWCLGIERETAKRWLTVGVGKCRGRVKTKTRKSGRSIPHKETKLAAAKLLYANGYNPTEVARTLDINTDTARRWLIPGERERYNRHHARYQKEAYTCKGPDPSKGRCQMDELGMDYRIAKHRERIMRGE